MAKKPKDVDDSFWSCNISLRGRLLRGLIGLLCLGAAAYLWWGLDSVFWSLGLLVFGSLALFESLRGWCVARAFGLRTPF